jgi:hypothetical protein
LDNLYLSLKSFEGLLPESISDSLSSEKIKDYSSKEAKTFPQHATVKTILGEQTFKKQSANSPIVGALVNNKIVGFFFFLFFYLVLKVWKKR